ncbi:MAG TPA: ABC transporter permease [Acidimicrobiales bacterium]|nr:ABC transporter permease [Acidimicrobiales bacterium]
MSAPPGAVDAPPPPAGGGAARAPTPRPGRLARLAAAGDALLLPALALLTALVVGGLVIAFSDPDVLDEWGSFLRDPLGALGASWSAASDAYEALWRASLGSRAGLGRTLVETAPLALAGLSVAFAFRAGLFNIGAAGQLVIGATCAGWVGFTWDLPAPLHVAVAVVAGLLGGAVWGGTAGILKARTGAHEVITTIMLNYVAYNLLNAALRSDAFQPAGRDDLISRAVAPSARLPELTLGGVTAHAGLLVALAATAAASWLLDRSTVGFHLRAVGANPRAARYAGMSVAAMYVLAMGVAGGLAGLAGTVNVLGRPSFTLTSGYYSFIGFDAIAVALLGRAHPGGVLAAAFLFGVLRAGSTGMQAATSTPVDIIVVIQALVILFVAAPALVRSLYRVRTGRSTTQSFSTGWGAG